MKRTISVMMGSGSLTHNRRDFIAENVDANRTYLNVKYCDEDIKAVYHELFDAAVERYNAKQTRKDRRIDDYYEKIRMGKQEKLFHEMIIQIGNRDDMAADSADGRLAAKILDEYMNDFRRRNPTLRVFNCYLHMDEATPHLHIDFVPYVSGWQGKGLDTRVSLKQALARLGFKGGAKRDTEWNQWVNSEKEALAAVMERHDIEWEQKGTHEEHLSVYDYKKQERAKEVAKLEQENLLLTAEQAQLSREIDKSQSDIEALTQEKFKAKEAADKERAWAAEAKKEADRLSGNLAVIRPIMYEVQKETREFHGKMDDQLPKAGTLELATTFRENKAMPLFRKMRNKIAALAAKLYEANQQIQALKKERSGLKKEVDALTDDNYRLWDRCEQLAGEKSEAEEKAGLLDRVVRVLGREKVMQVVQADIARERAEQEAERRRMESEPPCTASLMEKLAWYKAHPEYRGENGGNQRRYKDRGEERQTGGRIQKFVAKEIEVW